MYLFVSFKYYNAFVSRLLALGNDVLFGCVNVVVPAGNSRSLGVSEPWVFVGALATCVHIPGVGHVALLQRQGTLARDVARLGRIRHRIFAVPRLNRSQLLQGLWLSNPRQGLGHRNKVNVGTEMFQENKIQIILSILAYIAFLMLIGRNLSF